MADTPDLPITITGINFLVAQAVEQERLRMKKYVDAKIADAIRTQAWLKLSWNYAGRAEEQELAEAEKELMR